MFVAVRTAVYAMLVLALILLSVRARLPASLGPLEWAGMLVGAAGAGIVLWSVWTFAAVGKGTPAPFDPPRRLVTSGPYRFVRNPIYVGIAGALTGAALVYGSLPLLGGAALLLLAAHAFVVWYEEPALRRAFGREYEDYGRRVRRWWPRRAP